MTSIPLIRHLLLRGNSHVVLQNSANICRTATSGIINTITDSSRGVSRFFSVATEESTSSSSTNAIIPGVGKGKTSTGLVGIPVDPDALSKLISKNQALLDKMAQSDMPPTAQYYINIEKIANYRIKAAQENMDDPEKVEELCNCGQVEELVIQADKEMIVLDMYLKNKWWKIVQNNIDIEFYDDDEPSGDGSKDEEGVDWSEGMDKKDG